MYSLGQQDKWNHHQNQWLKDSWEHKDVDGIVCHFANSQEISELIGLAYLLFKHCGIGFLFTSMVYPAELSIDLGIYIIALGVCGAELGEYIIAAVSDTIGIEPSG